MKYSRDQLHVSASGVHFNEVSVKRELTLLTQVEDFVKILARFSAWEGIWIDKRFTAHLYVTRPQFSMAPVEKMKKRSCQWLKLEKEKDNDKDKDKDTIVSAKWQKTSREEMAVITKKQKQHFSTFYCKNGFHSLPVSLHFSPAAKSGIAIKSILGNG